MQITLCQRHFAALIDGSKTVLRWPIDPNVTETEHHAAWHWLRWPATEAYVPLGRWCPLAHPGQTLVIKCADMLAHPLCTGVQVCRASTVELLDELTQEGDSEIEEHVEAFQAIHGRWRPEMWVWRIAAEIPAGHHVHKSRRGRPVTSWSQANLQRRAKYAASA